MYLFASILKRYKSFSVAMAKNLKFLLNLKIGSYIYWGDNYKMSLILFILIYFLTLPIKSQAHKSSKN